MEAQNHEQKQICIRVTPEEHEYISKQAEQMKTPISRYIKKKIFDTSAGRTEQYDRIMQLIPVLQTTIDEVKDASVRQELRALGGQICQNLK